MNHYCDVWFWRTSDQEAVARHLAGRGQTTAKPNTPRRAGLVRSALLSVLRTVGLAKPPEAGPVQQEETRAREGCGCGDEEEFQYREAVLDDGEWVLRCPECRHLDRLRWLSADEVDVLHRISNEPDLRLYLWDNVFVSEATIKGLIARSERTLSEERIGVFGVRMRGSEDLLGFCGIVRLGGMEEPELWYELTRKAWGRWLATEAAWACVRYALEEVCGQGARDRGHRRAQHRLAAGDREARHGVLGEHQPKRPGRTLLWALQEHSQLSGSMLRFHDQRHAGADPHLLRQFAVHHQ